MHLARHIEYWSQMRPQAAAVTCEDQTLTWTELNAKASAFASELTARGAAPGDRIGCMMPNNLEWAVAFTAAIKGELLFVPLNAMFGPNELQQIAKDSGCRFVVSTPSLAKKLGINHGNNAGDSAFLYDLGEKTPPTPLDEMLSQTGAQNEREYDESDALAICYTSGTTGQPKGAVHTHQTVSVMITGLAAGYGMTADDTFLLVAPLAFTGGIICNLAVSLYLGAHIIIEQSFDPPRTLEILVRERVTAFGGAAIFWQRLAELPGFTEADLSALRHGFTGGAPVTRELIAQFQNKGVGIRQAYGCTECCGGATIPTLEEAIRNPNSCGKAMLGLRLVVCDDEGNPCPPNTPGEIRLAGPQLMRGYWNNAEKTAEAFDGEWYLTGDIGLINDDGSVVVVDRKKSMIISGGVNVYPAEVEKVLSAKSFVGEAAVFGVPSQQWGEEVVAIVVSRSALDESSVVETLKEELGRYKAPKRVRFTTDPLPRTATGKIDRLKLPALFDKLG